MKQLNAVLLICAWFSAVYANDNATCFDRIDQTLSAATLESQSSNVLVSLLDLDKLCPNQSNIQYNIGAAYAKQQDWENALLYFHNALKLTKSAYQSFTAMQKIHRYRAVLAYRAALNSNSPEPSPPTFSFHKPSLKESVKTEIPPLSEQKQDNNDLKLILQAWYREKALSSEFGISPVSSENPSDSMSIPEYLQYQSTLGPLIIVKVESVTYTLQLRDDDGILRIVDEQSLQ